MKALQIYLRFNTLWKQDRYSENWAIVCIVSMCTKSEPVHFKVAFACKKCPPAFAKLFEKVPAEGSKLFVSRHCSMRVCCMCLLWEQSEVP